MCGAETDSPRSMADSYLTGGSMHGDLALIAGARVRNLTESQYGLASIKFRWSVSGTCA
jgi:hypothetical protein